MTNLEKAFDTKAGDQVKPNQQHTQGFKESLIFTTETFQNVEFSKDKLLENTTLLKATLHDPRFIDSKLAECILLSKVLSDTKESIKSSESLKLLESLNSKNWKTKDSRCNKSRSTEKNLLTEPSINTKLSSRCQNFCLKTREDFGFIWKPSFLVLSVSFLFLA